jgi:hypothetical protein
MGRRMAVVCALLVVALVGAAGTDPASADTPTITVTPTSINGGDHVQVKLTGFAGGGIMGLFTCKTADFSLSGAGPLGAGRNGDPPPRAPRFRLNQRKASPSKSPLVRHWSR